MKVLYKTNEGRRRNTSKKHRNKVPELAKHLPFTPIAFPTALYSYHPQRLSHRLDGSPHAGHLSNTQYILHTSQLG